MRSFFSLLHFSRGVRACEVSRKKIIKEIMDSASSDNVLCPRGDKVPRRSYMPQRTRKVQFLPPAEAINLMSGTRVRCYCKVVRKPNMLEVRAWNLKTLCSSHVRSAHTGALNVPTAATSHALCANQTGKAHQESIETLKPLGISLKGCGSCLTDSNLDPSLNDHTLSANLDQKSEFGASTQKGMEKLPSGNSIDPENWIRIGQGEVKK